MRNRVFLNSPRMQLSILMGLTLGVFVSLAGCGGGGGGTGGGGGNTPPPNPVLATITGVVKDTSPGHNPVKGATVTVTGTGRSAITDSTGTFVVTNVPLSATSLTVSSPDPTAYYNIANYHGSEYDLTKCSLGLPLPLAAGANAPFTEIDMYIGGNNPPPPPPVGGCPS